MEKRSIRREPVLVGRQQELTKLWQLFEEALDGHLQVALIDGEPGIGKTRLLREMAQRAEVSCAAGASSTSPGQTARGGYLYA